MYTTGVFICALALSSALQLFGATPHLAFERSVTNLNTVALLPDNLGRIALVGATADRAGVFLFDTEGDLINSAVACFPAGISNAPSGAVTDTAGRLFLLWPVAAISFEPGLTALSRHGGWNAHYDTFRDAVADNEGGVYGAFRYSTLGFSYVTHFRCSEPRQGVGTSIRGDITITHVCRAKSGNVYLIGSKGWSRYARTQVVASSANGEVLWDVTLGDPPYEVPYAAQCDSQGNLLIAGSYRAEGPASQFSDRPSVVKVTPTGAIAWRYIWAEGGAFGDLALNRSDEIVVTGNHGIFKISPEGTLIWRDTEPSGALRLSANGEIVVQLWSADGPTTLRKVSANGSEVWHHDSILQHGQGLRDFTVDDEGAIYLAITTYVDSPTRRPIAIESLVRKFVNEATIAEVKPPLEVPTIATCESFPIGLCDVPPPLPPPPPAVVTVTRLPQGKMSVCWPTNYPQYRLEAARHINKRRPENTRWVPVLATMTTNSESYCVTTRIAKYGRNYRIVP